jgi:DMSO/TMAO reductase YedYZ molybdopterin-dependent catalytic subunit
MHASSRKVTRRTLLQGGAALAAVALLAEQLPATASASPAGKRLDPRMLATALDFPERPGEQVIPWLDQPADNPVPDILGTPLKWEELHSWITPDEQFFTVKHYAQPEIDPAAWSLEITGLVERPMTLSLSDLQARASRDVPFTLECSGNSGLPFLIGGIGNAVWTGTSLAALLHDAGVTAEGSYVVFWGTDSGPETVNGIALTEQFARAMSLADALAPENILCWGMNGNALPPRHGGPVRLIAPGWYGIANVKWLRRIEVLDRPYEGRFMARDYVTIRQTEQDGQTIARMTSVGHARLKSAPAKVTVLDGHYRIVGAAWGGPIARVEVQIDGGSWLPATIEERGDDARTWVIWTLDWEQPADGEHTITSRAIDSNGNVQPAPDDPLIATKLTYWESNGQITRHVVIGARTFPETGHTLSGAFLAFWEQHGGLDIFGYPMTEPFEEVSLTDNQPHTVQYFERQRFELHPENPAPYNVLLGLLGAELYPGGDLPPRAEPDGDADCEYVEATGHNVCEPFRSYWQQRGGLMIFGYPISEATTDGDVTVQHFERARFEQHAGYAPPYDVVLGLLGSEALQARYGDNLPPGAE